MTFDEINAVAEMIRELPVLTAQDMAEITDLVQTGYMPNEKLAEYRPLIDAANARSNRADREALWHNYQHTKYRSHTEAAKALDAAIRKLLEAQDGK